MRPQFSKLPRASITGAAAALFLLTALNFTNFVDRYILPGVQELVKQDFRLSDERVGALTFWFFLTYMCAAPLTGWLGDRYPRKPLIVLAALFWSASNLFTATVHSYFVLAVRHAALGIGEASFSIYAPALLADFYPPEQRNRVLTLFYTAIPVGAAAGYALGGSLGGHYGWRIPFFVSAFPGILIALLILAFIQEPPRGATDREPRGERRSLSPVSLVRNTPYLYATLGLAMVVFTMGGISFWIPSFLQRRAGYSPGAAGLIVGALTAIGGLGGTAFGGWIAQRWLRTNHRALYLVSAWSAVLTIPPALLCFFGPRSAIVPGLAVALFVIFVGNGPLNAAIVNSVPAAIRSTAIAIELFLIHLLGDAPSPRVIGFVSDHSTLGTGLGVTLVSLVLAGVLLFLGAGTLDRPQEPGEGRSEDGSEAYPAASSQPNPLSAKA
jgi:MFS transporter, Spinster family, sphingosine-1-phosphate transporter